MQINADVFCPICPITSDMSDKALHLVCTWCWIVAA